MKHFMKTGKVLKPLTINTKIAVNAKNHLLIW